jgi:hypothetical protein
VGIADAERQAGLLYIARGDNFTSFPTGMIDSVLALDLDTGRIVWFKQVTHGDVFSGACSGGQRSGPDHDFGSAVIIEKLPTGHDLLLAGPEVGCSLCAGPGSQRRNPRHQWWLAVGHGQRWTKGVRGGF